MKGTADRLKGVAPDSCCEANTTAEAKATA
jgi:hypothetical protein